MPYVQISAPVEEPVSLAEAKLAARIDDARFDELIPGLITAGRERAEQETDTVLMPQAWRLQLEDWPDEIRLDKGPVGAVSKVEFHNGTSWVELASTAYVVVTDRATATVRRVPGQSWPALGNVAGYRVRVDHAAGYASVAEVPEQVKLFIKLFVSCALDDRELPAYAQRLLDAAKDYA